MYDLFLASSLSFILSFILTKLKIRLKLAIAHPNDRSSHKRPIPTGGGFAALISFVFFIFCASNSSHLPESWHIDSPIILSSICLGILGLLDDIFSLPAIPRLFAQFALATWVVLSLNLSLQIVLPESTLITGGLAQIVAILWIVIFVNLFNFMDGANGMIALGSITCCLLTIIVTPSFGLAYAAIGIAAAMIGFLPMNFPHARIFLGDSGSQSFGFLIACLLLTAHNTQPSRFSFYTMVLAFLPYLYDAGITTLLRLLTGKNILKPHREFLFHRLLTIGWQHYMVSCLYMIMLLICGIGVEFSSRTYILNHFIMMMIALFFMTLFRSIVAYSYSKFKKTQEQKHQSAQRE